MVPAAPSGPGSAPHEDPRKLIAVLFVVGTLMAVLVGYLGETGKLGGPIPGTYPGSGSGARTCEGRNATGSFHFLLIAGEHGSYSFNGTTPGPCLEVGAGSSVEITYRVDPSAGTNHSFDVIPASGPTNVSPVFSGAGLTGAQRFVGIAPGTEVNFSFVASPAGVYRYVCEVPGHVDLGMIGWLNVTRPANASVAVGLSSALTGSEAPGETGWVLARTSPSALEDPA